MKDYGKNYDLMFEQEGPFWHAHTNGKESSIIFKKNEDFCLAINLLCLASIEINDVGVIAAEFMDNHVHLLLSGQKTDVDRFTSSYEARLRRAMSSAAAKDIANDPLPSSFQFELKQITDVQYLRVCIVYIHRNAFVSNPKWIPFNYPWSTGRYYFTTNIVSERKLSALSFKEKRNMFRSRIPSLPDTLNVVEGHVDLSSFCNIQLGMSFFTSAHQYFSMLFKNVEAYSGIATEVGDDDFMSDSELYEIVNGIVREKYHLPRITTLSSAQRLDVAKTLHYNYRSSNGQIRRILGIPQIEIDTLFPLSAKNGR